MSYYIWGLIAFVVGLIAYSSYTPSTKPIVTATLTPVLASPVQIVTVDRTAQINSCIQQADDLYTESWKNNCQQQYNSCMASGVISSTQCYSWYGDTCSLGNTTATQLNTNWQRDKLNCFRQY